jgi:hypothetical protein
MLAPRGGGGAEGHRDGVVVTGFSAERYPEEVPTHLQGMVLDTVDGKQFGVEANYDELMAYLKLKKDVRPMVITFHKVATL